MNRLLVFVMVFLGSGVFGSAYSVETLTLEEVIKEVCSKSDSMKVMRETIKKSDQIVREKWANALPTLSANASFGQGQSSLFMGPQFSRSYISGISLSQPIFTFGKVGTAIKVAKHFDNSTHSNYQRSLQKLQVAGVDAFFNVLLADMAVNVAVRSIERKKELGDFLERNFQLGSGAKAQLIMTQADIRSTWTEILTAKQGAKAAQMMLSSQIGRSLSDSIGLDTNSIEPFLVTLKIPPKEEAVSIALQKRSDLRSLAYIEQATRGGAKIFKAMNYPTIGFNGSTSFNSNKLDKWFDEDKLNWSLGFGMQWTFFDGFANNAISKQYLSDAEKLAITRQTVSKMIEIEVISAYSECEAADTNILASQQMLSAAQESYDLTNETFKMGSGQFADLQLAEDRLRQAELGIVNARYRQLKSRVAVLVACGQDIVNVEDK